MPTELDLITVGRVSVDLYANELNTSFLDPQTFTKSIGGSPINVAVAASRLGNNAATATKVGNDPLGSYVIEKLMSFGVNTNYVAAKENSLTPIVLAALDPPSDPKISFYRGDAAPDTTLLPSDISPEAIMSTKALWISACAMSQGSTALSVFEWLESRNRARHTILDLDYRKTFWKSPADARAAAKRAISLSTVVVGNKTECEVALGIIAPQAIADELLKRGVELAVVKMGGEGVMLATKDERHVIPPLKIDVICGLGAGDAFGGALVHGLLHDWPIKDIGNFANAAGAYVAARLLCSDAMPNLPELVAFMKDGR